MKFSELESFYASCNEENRLSLDQAHSIEFITTIQYLKKHLPPNCSVLDCCAGCGAYAFSLAEDGYQVTAGDLVKEHVDLLNHKNTNGLLKSVYQGNVLELSNFADGSFDSVLCMGALYHLQEEAMREACVAECLRVLKSGGIFIFAYINRNAVYINHFKNKLSDIAHREYIRRTGVNGMFYAMGFNEQNELANKFSLEKITDVGVDGLIYPLFDELNTASPEEFNAYLNYHLATCEEASLIGHSSHGLWIGKKI